MTSSTGVNRTSRVELPSTDGRWHAIDLMEPRQWDEHPHPHSTRIAFAAAHAVADPLADNTPGAPAALDWDATLAFRRHLFRHGFGVAEAMDTAQRNMGLGWDVAQELIIRSAAQARELGASIASGAGTDHLVSATTTDDVTAGYLQQIEVVEGAGSQVILMSSRELAQVATGPDDYLRVYSHLLAQASGPVILHWLGEAFDPRLRGYWGSTDIAAATATFLDLVRAHADAIDGVKVSLLSAEHETSLRAALPTGVRLYTGDDFNYPELIRGDGTHHSDALLGAFAAVAPAASAALTALDAGDLDLYDTEMAPTLALSRHLFERPTFHYKTGIAFVAWLSGHQDGFTMVGGLQSARSVTHLATVFALANECRLLPDPELAGHRLRLVLAASGIVR
ncbi:dihydrodipicolinate synthase family protein [Aeromicrobium sp.]|uniref:dihydrodipicolinate synthase family protein n=1 Tax=Aeromicrobium sp. TaxID=1871063 RepID=UPI0025C603C5|nr:dihydrodipicolinate synthase family protein [Aeromicrobium sp.]